MKVLWGTSLDPIRDGDRFDGEVFAAAETDAVLLQRLEKAQEQEEKIITDAELPLGWYILRELGGLLFLIVLSGILRANATLAQGYRNAPGLYWAGGIGGVLWLVLWLTEKCRQRRRGTKEQRVAIRQRVKSIRRSCYEALDVPENAAELDVLAIDYRRDGGGVRPVFRGAVDNIPVRMWRRDSTLCMADVSARMEVPLGCMTGLAFYRYTVRLSGWNKRRSWRQYKQQGTFATKYGVSVKGCCVLSVQREGEMYQIWLPGYEKSAAENLTGLQAEEAALPCAEKKRKERPAREKKERPKSRWRIPEGALDYFLPDSDEEFKQEHPWLYPLLVVLGLVAFLGPLALYCILVGKTADSWWAILGGAGSLIVGIGLFNIVAIAVRQYLGHIVTIGCFLLGGVMIGVSLLLI